MGLRRRAPEYQQEFRNKAIGIGGNRGQYRAKGYRVIPSEMGERQTSREKGEGGERTTGQRTNGDKAKSMPEQEVMAVIAGVDKLKAIFNEQDLPDPTRLMLEAFHGTKDKEATITSPTHKQEAEGSGDKGVERTDRSTDRNGESEKAENMTAAEDPMEPYTVEGQNEEADIDLPDIQEMLEEDIVEDAIQGSKGLVQAEKGEKRQGVKKKLFPPTAIFVGRIQKNVWCRLSSLPAKHRTVGGRGKRGRGMMGLMGRKR